MSETTCTIQDGTFKAFEFKAKIKKAGDIKMKNSLAYIVIEDNAGGLHLFVFEDINGDGCEKIIYEHSGYEYVEGQLTDDLKELASGAHPSNWEGCEDNPQKDYDDMISIRYGYKIVAACDYHGSPKIYVADMGLSAQREFNINED